MFARALSAGKALVSVFESIYTYTYVCDFLTICCLPTDFDYDFKQKCFDFTKWTL